MDYQSLYLKTVAELRKIAKEMGVRIPAGTGKSVLINMLLEAEKQPLAAQDAKPKAGEGETGPKKRGRPRKNPDMITESADKTDGTLKENAQDTPRVGNVQREIDPLPMRMAAHPQVVGSRGDFIRDEADADDRQTECENMRFWQSGPAVSFREKPGMRNIQETGRGYPPRQEGLNQNRNGQYVAGCVIQRQDVSGQRYAARQENAPQGSFQPQESGFRYPRNHQENVQPARHFRENTRPAQAYDAPGADGANRREIFNGISEGCTPRQEAYRNRREGYYNEEYKTSNPAVPEMLAAGECADGAGVLELQPDGYGFLRAENCLPGSNDVYVSIAQVRRFGLRMGDYVEGKTRPQREGDRYTAMMYITRVNGEDPETAAGRRRFDELIPVYPDRRLRLEGQEESDPSLRMIDLFAPIGKGQRGLIVSPPKAGKTTLIKKIANAITNAHPEIHLIVLLIDERPEEVTDMKRGISGEVIYSTFDEAPENHTRVSEMVLERAKRLVETGKDVVVLMDSITRLARAYNLTIPPTGRSLSGGLDPGALHKPKKFFGAARNTENGGSLTIIATALVDTGSRMDDIIYEEFKGTGNMEMHLDRKLSDRRIFPAVDMVKSGTRREELLLSEKELECARKVRRMLSGANAQEDAERLIAMMEKSADNEEFMRRISGVESVYEKMGYTMSGK